MRRINPAVKFLTLLIVTFILAYKFNPVLNLGVFAICILAMLLSKVKPKSLVLWMLPVMLAAAGMFFTGYRFSASDSMPVSAEAFLIYDSQLWNGIAHASRVLAYAGIGFLFTFTTDRIELVHSFRFQFHLPQVFAYGLLAAWGIVPHMMLEYKRTKIAFKARGIRVLPFSPALLKPLLVKSIRWSEELAIAMESKGFSGSEKRTDYEKIRIRVWDILFMAAAIAAVILLG